ncbi:hypothetical protein CVS40_8923 [Lucilia cuprina]|nr:hypothetical protein CVS40_8923 [Lucilia cuprina]
MEKRKNKDIVCFCNNLEVYVFGVKQALDQAGDKILHRKGLKPCVHVKIHQVAKMPIHWLEGGIRRQDEFTHKVMYNTIMTN